MGAPPQISLADRQAALAKAAEARKIRADIKKEIKNGSMNIQQILSSDLPAIKKMRVQQMLIALPGVGLVRAQSIMERCNISATRRIQGLGVNQRKELLSHLGFQIRMESE